MKSGPANFGLSLVSGILLILLFPRFNLTWLAPVALTPLLIACAREPSWKLRFLYGWVCGIVFWWGVCYWIQFVLQDHGGLGLALSWVSFALFTVLKGLHFALFAALAGFLMPRRWAIPAVAGLWIGLERTNGPFGFAWLDLGNAGIGMPIAMRAAPFVGVYGLSFAFAMLASAVALIVLRRPRRELAWLIVLLALPVLPALPPSVSNGEPGMGQARMEQARVVQPNVDTEANFTQQSLAELMDQMRLLSHAPGASMIVWPEWPAPFELDPTFRAFVGGIARDSHAFLIFNGVARSTQGEPLNSAYFVNPEAAIVDRYDQINLVPFGEYVPAPFGWVNRITKETSDFVPGDRVTIFKDGNHRLGIFICYESAFPDLVRQFPRDGAEVLFNLSNDGYFAHSAAREQHLNLTRMRAAENRRWVVASTNDGLTATIDPAGRVTDRLPPYRLTAGDMRYGYVQETTFYTRHGDWFAWGSLVLSLVLCCRRGPLL